MKMRLLSLSLLSAALALCISTSAMADDAKGSISGKVVDAKGDAVKSAKVYVMKPGDLPAPGAGGRRGAADAGDKKAGDGAGRAGARGAIFDKAVAKGDVVDGAYKIADVPAGKYVVVVNAGEAGRGRADVEVSAGQETKVDEIKLAVGRGPGAGGAGGARGGRKGGADAPK